MKVCVCACNAFNMIILTLTAWKKLESFGELVLYNEITAECVLRTCVYVWTYQTSYSVYNFNVVIDVAKVRFCSKLLPNRNNFQQILGQEWKVSVIIYVNNRNMFYKSLHSPTTFEQSNISFLFPLVFQNPKFVHRRVHPSLLEAGKASETYCNRQTYVNSC